MKINLSFLLLLCTTCLFAQQPYVVKRDTINMHGYIYDSSGKPINFLHIESTQLETEHNTFKLGAYTNDQGYFELKGARFNDTLTLGPDIHYDLPPYYNMGSRYLVIYLPPAKVVDMSQAGAIVIAQKRKYPKTTASFTVTPSDNKTGKENISLTPRYPGGTSQLEEYLKQNIHYPEKAIINNMEGIVQISFTVTKEGYHKDIRVVRGISDECDEEVLRVIKKSPNWEPALDHNQPVAMQETLSVQFKLTDN
jgi:TonB family protein